MTAPTMPCSTPSPTTTAAVPAAIRNSSRRTRKNAAHPLQVDQLDADEEYHRGKDGVGQVSEGTGEKQQDQKHYDRGREGGSLTASPGAVHHLGLGRAAVHDERSGESGHQVGRPESVEVDVLVECPRYREA